MIDYAQHVEKLRATFSDSLPEEVLKTAIRRAKMPNRDIPVAMIKMISTGRLVATLAASGQADLAWCMAAAGVKLAKALGLYGEDGA